MPSEPIKTCQAKAARESAAGKSAALRSLLEASVEGGALHGAGICGRLGDLGVIGAEYDAAVSVGRYRVKVEMNINCIRFVDTSCCFRAEKFQTRYSVPFPLYSY